MNLWKRLLLLVASFSCTLSCFSLELKKHPIENPALAATLGFSSLFLTLLLFFLARKRPFFSLCSLLAPPLLGLLFLLSLASCFFPHSLAVLVPSHLLLVWLQNILFPLFFWGGINLLVEKSFALRYYFLLSFGTLLFRELCAAGIQYAPESLEQYTFLIGTILLSITSYLTLSKAPSSSPSPKETPLTFPFVSASYFLAGPLLIVSLSRFFSKILATPYGYSAQAYTSFVAQTSFVQMGTYIAISILGALLSTLYVRAKGWHNSTSYLRRASLLFFLPLFLSIPFFPSSWSLGFGQGSFLAIAWIAYTLVQISYLSFPREERFRAKILTEGLLFPLFCKVPAWSAQGMLILTGTSSLSSPPIPKILLGLLACSFPFFLLALARYKKKIS